RRGDDGVTGSGDHCTVAAGRALTEPVLLCLGDYVREVLLTVVVRENCRAYVIDVITPRAQVARCGVDGVPGVLNVGLGARRPVRSDSCPGCPRGAEELHRSQCV